ncbi:DNA repair protein rad5 [Colletotrichum asianum]|uniref:DNA repair protein rad5 n=1 Tax=Colletotrichum asianum TaxID=702518 RepID=A0A8H3W6I9_9PEZI|nr:DNA repair protein rad5 [Colletotrichum asianum]
MPTESASLPLRGGLGCQLNRGLSTIGRQPDSMLKNMKSKPFNGRFSRAFNDLTAMQRSFDDAFSYREVGIGSQAEYCFGALYDGAALPTVAGTPSEQAGRELITSCGDFDDFAILDLQSSNRLEVIEHLETVRFEAMVEATALRKRKKGTKAKPTPVSLSINVYGMQSIADELGRKLSNASTFLQHPKALPQDKNYDNPHFFKFSEEEDMKALVGITNDSPSARRARISDEISNILECLAEDPGGGTMNYIYPKGLLSKLKPHQEQGVRFIIHREARHEQEQAVSSCGGILADVMGLGKTLTVLTSLRSWLRAVCIRRTEKLLDLPDSTEETIQVTMSQEEKKLYEQVLQQSKREIDDVLSKGKSIKKYNILFTAILRMRMLCNSGTFPKPANPQKYLGDGQAKETGCEQCAVSNDEDTALLLTTFQFCPDCGRSLQFASPGSNTGSSRGSNSPLPGCSPAPSEILSFSTGHSAKLSAVLDRIRASGLACKHIVFSYWTSTLDLLSSLLDNVAMNHVQVDGRTGYTERSRRLQQFRENHDTPVLLMSIETGALGLNLTAANYVHIVEPQWNPSVEEQAVARALRMGQTRKVSVFRYVVGGSVEQNIMHLQKKKKNVAKFMFNVGAAEELDGKLEVRHPEVNRSDKHSN